MSEAAQGANLAETLDEMRACWRVAEQRWNAERAKLEAENERLRRERDHWRDTVIESLERELVEHWRAERDALRAALKEAADGLGKAANQFEALKQSPDSAVDRNPAIFAEKERRAREALGDRGRDTT